MRNWNSALESAAPNGGPPLSSLCASLATSADPGRRSCSSSASTYMQTVALGAQLVLRFAPHAHRFLSADTPNATAAMKQNCTTNPSLKALNDDCHDAILGLFACCIRYEGPPAPHLPHLSASVAAWQLCTNHKVHTPHTTPHRVLHRTCSLVSSATDNARHRFSPTCLSTFSATCNT